MKKGDKYAIDGSKLFILSGKRKGRKRDIESYDPSNGLLTFKRVWYERALEWFKKPAVFATLPWNHRAKSTTNAPTESSAHLEGRDMAKDITKGIVDEAQSKYTAACVKCLTTDHLCMMPIRAEGRLVGWLFACPEHFEGLKEQDWILGKELRKLRGAELRRPLSSRSCPGMADTSKCNDPDRKVTCTLCPKWIGD